MPKYLTSLISLFLTLFSVASFARPPAHNCSVSIAIRGASTSFYLWGKDTWEGDGLIECHKKDPTRWNSGRGDVVTAPVFAKYEGWGPGYGATGTSEVILSLEGFDLADIQQIYGSYRTLGGTAQFAGLGGEFILLTQNASLKLVWSLMPQTRAVNPSAFLQFGQLILSPSKNRVE